ncbi:MAG: cystathionine gamma-synthase family protein [Acidilobaceae archaeon]
MKGFSTLAIHGHECRDLLGSHVPPIYIGNIYEYVDEDLGLATFSDRGHAVRYGREENPTVRCLERLLAKLEGVEDALVFNSGMAAISSVFMFALEPGDEVVVPIEVYSSVLYLLDRLARKMGLKVKKVWPSAEAIVEAVSKETKLIFLEVQTNPTNKVIDLKALASAIDLDSKILIVDNTITTPLLVKPAKHGARLVVHSATKHLSGHNDVVGGVVAGRSSDLKELWDWRRTLGNILQPFEAYMVIRGLKTLEARFEKASKTALEIAEFLEDHPKVEEVLYPGLSSSPYHEIALRLFERRLFGTLVSFRLKGSYKDTIEFLLKLKVIKRAPSFGGAESLAVLPARSASRFIDEESRVKLGITENLVRLSVGLEDSKDLIEDLSRALAG